MMLPSGLARCRWPPGAALVGGSRVVQFRRTSTIAETKSDSREESAPDTDVKRQNARTNVSGLRDWHYRKYHGQPPLLDEGNAHVSSLRYQRKLWAVYGRQSGVSPAIGWPVREEWEDKMEYEALAYPDTLQQMVQKFRAEEDAKQTAIAERMQTIEKNMLNLEKWKKEIIGKKEKKVEAIRAAQEKRDKMIQEVKEIVGYRVDPNDARFKEVLADKEKEEKRLEKETRKKQKQFKALERFRKSIEVVETSGTEVPVEQKEPAEPQSK